MTVEDQTYRTIESLREAKQAGATRNRNGFRPLHTIGLTVTWSNEPTSPRAKINMTRTAYVNSLAARDNVNLT